MAHIVFRCGNSDGVVRQSKLFLLWAMMNEFNIDMGLYMVGQLARVGKAKTGSIVVRGLITLIMLALGYDVTSLKEARGSTRIDIESYITMKMIMKVGDVYCLMFKDPDITHPLSNLEHTTIKNRANWSFSMTRA
ncbi:hypothetical protein Ancab_018883 [Ancistrocladus abbreviatus]